MVVALFAVVFLVSPPVSVDFLWFLFVVGHTSPRMFLYGAN